MITSSSNAQVKQMIQLNKKARERRKQDVFLVEGLRMFREVPRERLVKTYVSESFLEDPEHQVLLQGIPYEMVKDSVFAQMSDTLTLFHTRNSCRLCRQSCFALMNFTT